MCIRDSFGELYTAVEETIVLLGAGVGAFEFTRDISLEYGVSLGNQSIEADILGAVIGVGVDEDVVARAHRGVGHPEEVLADTLIANILRDIDAMSEEAIDKLGSLLAVGLSDNLTVEEAVSYTHLTLPTTPYV